MDGSDSKLHRLRRKLDCFMQYGWVDLEDISLIRRSSGHDGELVNHIGATSTALADECNQSNLAIYGQLKSEAASDVLSIDKRAEIQGRLQTLRPLIGAHSASIEVSYKRYRHLQYKLQLMIIAQSLDRISSSQNILQIPSLVLDSISLSNIIILQKSKLYQYTLDVVRSKKAKLLLKFHRLFEETLDSENDANINDEEDPTSASSTTSQQQNIQQQMWERFLRLSREWLLAYTMVSLLPAALARASSQTFQERFEDALDEAMTPLWGRFYHHLKLGRESGSWQQMLWTFGYARSFMTMLTTLCSQITRAPEMASMLGNNIDMNDTAKDQVLEKVMKFLYAHVAALLVITSTETVGTADSDCDGNLSQLIEEILDFDMWLDVEYNQPTLKYLIEIVYESKLSFHAWLMMEHDLLFAHFYNDVAKDIKQPYQLKFKSLPNELDGNDGKSDQYQCYIAIYDCLQLFLLLQQRFQHLPPVAQMIMAEVILEPLLCLSLGLLLYRVRTDSVLFDISIGSHHLQDPSSSWQDFRDTITYFHKAILHLSQNSCKRFQADSARCRKRWTILQNWMPQKFIDSSLQSQRYSIQDMIRIALKVPEKYRDHRGYAYRSTLNNGTVKAASDDEDCTLASCVYLTNALATTVLAVMEQQLLGT